MILRVIDAFKTTTDQGYRGEMPLVHLIGRDSQWERHVVTIDEFRPYFVVPIDEWTVRGEDIADDERVLRAETTDLRGRDEQTLDGRKAVRVVCETPGDVADLRELFEDPHEADVLYPVRFLIDTDAYQFIRVPDEYGETVSFEDIAVVDEDDFPARTPPPRVCTYDIEVRQGGSGPPVVTKDGTEQVRNPITAISAHDSYTDEYRLWLLAHSEWDPDEYDEARQAVDVTVEIYDNPRSVVAQFLEWVVERGMDILTGWNADSFDHPYLINWALDNNVSTVYDLSPVNHVYEMDGDGKWINSSLKGRLLTDLMSMYEKCTVHELDSYRLADVAETEDVAVGKLSIEDEITVPADEPAIDYAWEYDPAVFAQYSLKDTQAAVGINRQSQENVNIL